MCGIIGFVGYNPKEAKNLAEKGLSAISYRGKDGTKTIDFCGVILGHNLHSVVSKVEQPIKGQKGVLVSNCEIYNWKELTQKYDLTAKNDSELLLKLIEKKGTGKINEILSEIDGDFAFAYVTKKQVILARDISGVKPLVFLHQQKKLIFASEKKALPVQSIHLNPRQIILFDIASGKLKIINQKINKQKINSRKPLQLVENVFYSAIQKRIPEKKFGLLLSGGIDSLLIGKIISNQNKKFSCYFAGVKNIGEIKDLSFAEKAAKEINCKLVTNLVSMNNFEKKLPFIINLIESSDPVRVGVASTIYFATKKMSGEKVVFSGLGADELFGGYSRFKNSLDINKDCYSYFLKMYENDLYFEDIVCMKNSIELRVPFLDKQVIEMALNLNPKMKINGNVNKKILREIAISLGLSRELAYRPKKAAQYGSNFDKAIEKLAKKNGFKSKTDYLNSFLNDKKNNLNIGALISTGKDSLYSAYLMVKQGYKISCFITIDSKNKDSFMYHTPTIALAKLQAKAFGVPLIIIKTNGEKELELIDLEKAIAKAKIKYKIEGVCSGALYSNYQRTRIETICEKLGVRSFAPLWHLNQKEYLKLIVKNGFEVIITKIACYGLNESYLGKRINKKMIEQLSVLEKKFGVNVAGEGGEYETLVLDMPLFKKKLQINNSETKMENEFTGELKINKILLIKK
jgi:diphthine-ammonia ligase